MCRLHTHTHIYPLIVISQQYPGFLFGITPMKEEDEREDRRETEETREDREKEMAAGGRGRRRYIAANNE